MKQQANPKERNGDAVKRLLFLPPTLDLMLALPLAGYAGYVMHSGDGSRIFGLLVLAIAFCFAGLGINAVLRNMRELKIVEQYGKPGQIGDLDETRLERMMRAYYITRGYMIEEPGDHREDPNYDFILVKAKERLLVRTRDWAENRVPISSLKKAWNAKRPVKANGIVVITNGEFDEDAIVWGRRQNVVMLATRDIEQLIANELGVAEPDKNATACGRPVEQRPSTPSSPTKSAAPVPPNPPTPSETFLFLDWAFMEKSSEKLLALFGRHPSLQVVASTGAALSDDALRSSLSSVGDRLCGRTTAMPQYGAAARYYEIIHFLAGKPEGRNAKWVALDSDPRAFPEGCTELVLANPTHGINDEALASLDAKMRR